MNRALSKIIAIILSEPITVRRVLRRALAVYGAAAILSLFKLRRAGPKVRRALTTKIFQDASWLLALLNGYPVARKILKNKFLSFNVALVPVLQLPVPPSASSYALLESTVDAVRNAHLPIARSIQFDDAAWNLARQAALSLLVPLLLKTRNTRVKGLLFSHKSIMRDFLALFALWNTISLYSFVKSSLYKQEDRQKRRGIDSNKDRETHNTLNSRVLKDKFREISELRTSRGTWDKVISCCFGENLTVAAKWAMWRQLLWFLMRVEKKPCSNMQLSSMLMLGFYVLDNSYSRMFVRPGVLRYLSRILIADRLQRSGNWQKTAVWAAFNLSFWNKMQEEVERP
ncbi:LAQU0S17e00628g1_1 [Lachancea quebecensis]|uniref:LAQU0S17e00628g1_1 n=1 Tax=Lachancea quebecensis TaxID=1654605 RepID=A0A0P1KWU6_9SACH|nr:LAQU0S17e00628g1_1 [Lachancea quebecensis]